MSRCSLTLTDREIFDQFMGCQFGQVFTINGSHYCLKQLHEYDITENLVTVFNVAAQLTPEQLVKGCI